MAAIDRLFDELLTRKGSDLHLSVGYPPMLRTKGDLVALQEPPLTVDLMESLLAEILDEERWQLFRREWDLDFAYSYGDKARFRANYLYKTTGPGAVFRTIPSKVLTATQLNLPKACLSLAERRSGLILVTGPTGSGKTTSLYAAINYLNSLEKNIVTIEDPVEYQLDIVNQNPVRENIGLSFAKMLKHVLRQDPDIIMVGEIRERETAEIAIQAALTGHLVLSTLHTNDSVGAVTRMIDMGVEPYLLSSALIGVVAQRLVRSICPACKTDYLASPELIAKYGWENEGKLRLSKGRGCPECYDSGYRGRLGIHELIETDTDLQRLIIANASRDELTDYLHEHQIRLLFDDGIDRVRDGMTTIEEIWRVINS